MNPTTTGHPRVRFINKVCYTHLMESILKLRESELKILARIHAHLCGDGCLCIYKTSEKDRINRAEIIYCNTNVNLINSFRQDMSLFFGVKMTYLPKQYIIKIKSLRIAEYLLKLGKYGCRAWRIPPVFKNASTRVKLEWIKAFCYDEGYLIEKKNLIRIKSMNHAGLKNIKEMLDRMDITSWITGVNCDGSWYLNIKKMHGLMEFYKTPSRKKVARGGFEPPTSGCLSVTL